MEVEKQIVIYKEKDGSVQLKINLRNETLWLTQAQLSLLFQTERSVITKHLRNIFQSGELSEESNVQKMHTAHSDKPVNLYSLDTIISVGYRVNSTRATQFRIWATRVLRDYTLKGVVVNEQRIKEAHQLKLKELEKTITLLQNVMRSKALDTREAQGLLSVITDYAHTWALLQQYDKGAIRRQKGTMRSIAYLEHDEALNAIHSLKSHLIGRRQASQMFGNERERNGLAGILQSVRQSFGGKDLYPSIEEKAAHLLYFIIKDHYFVDGNKRIASLLFILLLSRNRYLTKKNGERKINDNALVALALLIAESKSSEKEVMISLITNLLNG